MPAFSSPSDQPRLERQRGCGPATTGSVVTCARAARRSRPGWPNARTLRGQGRVGHGTGGTSRHHGTRQRRPRSAAHPLPGSVSRPQRQTAQRDPDPSRRRRATPGRVRGLARLRRLARSSARGHDGGLLHRQAGVLGRRQRCPPTAGWTARPAHRRVPERWSGWPARARSFIAGLLIMVRRRWRRRCSGCAFWV